MQPCSCCFRWTDYFSSWESILRCLLCPVRTRWNMVSILFMILLLCCIRDSSCVRMPNRLKQSRLSAVMRLSWRCLLARHWNVRPKGVFAHFCVFPLVFLFPYSSLGIFSRFRVTFTVFGEAAVFVGRVLRGAIGSRIFRSSDVRHRSETLSHIYFGHYIRDKELRQCLISIPVIICQTMGSNDEPFSCPAHVPASVRFIHNVLN